MDLRASSVETSRLYHLPLIREGMEELGILSVLSETLPMHPEALVSDSECALLMVANILQGRCALFRMSTWLDHTDAEVLIGEGCDPRSFSDTRLGKTLDRIYDYGTDNLFSLIAQRILRQPAPPTDRRLFHGDTTSLVLHGVYQQDPDDDEDGAPKPAYGYSKDKRPDLKQLMMSLCLDQSNRPCAFFPLDGNTADQPANRQLLHHIAENIESTEGATWVGDAKLVDPDTLGQLRKCGYHFVSLLPKTYALRTHLIDTAAEMQKTVVADKAPKKKDGPRRVWRAVSLTHLFPLRESPDADEELVALRFVVVESSQLAEKFEASLPKKLERERTALRKAVPKKGFACYADAKAAFAGIRKKEKLLVCELDVVEEQERLKTSKRGRPRKGEVRTRTVYRVVLRGVSENADAIAHARRHSSHFVLVTDHEESEEWSDADVFDVYQGQNAIEGKTGFRWLKDAAVAPVLLKTPRRIAALMMVFVVALLVRNHIESRVRARLAELGEEIRYYTRTRRTATPTAEVIFDCFQAVTVVCIRLPEQPVQRILANLDQHAVHVLDILGWSKDIFTTVRKRPAYTTEGL